MDNQTLLSQTIRFQRTAWQNSLAIISTAQQHGDKLLKSTLQQSPWIPANSKKACLFWADIWTNSLTGMTDLVARSLAEMERLSAAGDQQTKGAGTTPKKAPAKTPEPSRKAAARKEAPDKKTTDSKPSAAAKSAAKPLPAEKQAAKPPATVQERAKPSLAGHEIPPEKPAIEQVAVGRATAPKAVAPPTQPPSKQPALNEKPAAEPKV